MKKSLNFLFVLTLAIMVFTLTGCGKDLSAYAGNYVGEQSKLVGDTEWQSAEEEPFSIELKDNGKGKFTRDGESFDITWEIDGEKFTMKETYAGITIEYNGTLKDGKLHIYNGDASNDFTYEYELSKK